MMFPKGAYKAKRKARGRATLPESHIQRQCEDYLDARMLTYIRVPDGILKACFGAGSSMSVTMRRYMASFVKGVPDLTVLHRDGRYIAVELKTESGKQSLGQKQWARGVGDNYHIVRSFGDFKQLIDEWSKG